MSDAPPQPFAYDVFFSHAREDKATGVLPLTAALTAMGLTVWIDDAEMQLGDSPIASIHRGLQRSRFAIALLSRAYFERMWTQTELDGLMALEAARGHRVVLPVLHDITVQNLGDRYLPLAGRVFATTAEDPRRIADKVRAVVEAGGFHSPADLLVTTRQARPPQIAASRLPATGPWLLGREEALATLDAAWAARGRTRVLAISGLGGDGKTALVAHWAAAKLAAPDRGGIRRYFDWSFLGQGTADVTDGSTKGPRGALSDLFFQSATSFLSDAGVPLDKGGGVWARGERLAEAAGDPDTLLVLDGLEVLQRPADGGLVDDSMRALLLRLAAHSGGLCIVTTRRPLADLAVWNPTTAPACELPSLTPQAGAALLRELGVDGSDDERAAVAAAWAGHALTLTLLGRYLKRRHGGDVRRAERVHLDSAGLAGETAFAVIGAYQRWLEEDRRYGALALLRVLGLFDRPATPDCLSALCTPPIAGLTDVLGAACEDDWNEVVSDVEELGMVEARPWHPPNGWSSGDLPFGRTLDVHPLVRAYFARQLATTAPDAAQRGHERLFRHLAATAAPLPATLEELQPLYQAVAHGCKAGLIRESCALYKHRILRDAEHHSWHKLGAFKDDLAMMAHLFEEPWRRASSLLSEQDQGWLFNEAGVCLLSSGRAEEAIAALRASVSAGAELGDWLETALRCGTLAEAEVTAGRLDTAVATAREAIGFAERTGSWRRIRAEWTGLADALNQAGRADEALAWFRNAERAQRQNVPSEKWLYSLPGFWYLDRLLLDAEAEAWRAFLSLEVGTRRRRAGAACCDEVVRYATNVARLQRADRGMNTLDLALPSLVKARALLCRALLGTAAAGNVACARDVAEEALVGVHRAARGDYLPRALLTRAWARAVAGDLPGAAQDLDTAEAIAARGPMALHLADVHLHRARIFRDGQALVRAREQIQRCGYHRRRRELADAADGLR